MPETKTIPEGTDDAYVITTYLGRVLPHAYRNMLFSKWLRSLRYGNDAFGMILPKAYFSYHHLLIEALLEKPGTAVRIAALSDNLDVVLGFCVFRESVIDYVYVNRDMRRQGIGTALCPFHQPEGIVFTHFTKTSLSITDRKFPLWWYNPYV